MERTDDRNLIVMNPFSIESNLEEGAKVFNDLDAGKGIKFVFRP